MNGDPIAQLPTDQSPLSPAEVQLSNTLFQAQSSVFQTIFSLRDILAAGVLFLIFSIPQTSEFVKKIFPSTANSPYILLLVLCLSFMLALFVMKTIYLVRK